ncbi:MAG: beta galactosidase jelly roll domain-containing protein [Methanosarcinaceae archaeon]
MHKIYPWLLIIILLTVFKSWGKEFHKEINLKGRWRFEIGDDLKWAKPDFDDSQWDVLYAPAFWEDQDYPGYDGYAWYRRTISISGDLKEEMLFLRLGQIDDVDQVYFNGVRIGSSGRFPPDYQTAYHVFRDYFVPNNLIKFDGENIIAIRVFDAELSGGIAHGDLGIYSQQYYLKPDLNLTGYWAFHTGDDPEWANPELNDRRWESILVPVYWERQGYEDYDGFAWYRKRFQISEELAAEPLFLLLGRIDDVDEVFLNGTKIGQTGPFPEPDYYGEYGDWWLKDRVYSIPKHLIRTDRENVIAVRVFDCFVDGGFHDGPVGIIRKSHYKKSENDWDLGDILIKLFFNK